MYLRSNPICKSMYNNFQDYDNMARKVFFATLPAEHRDFIINTELREMLLTIKIMMKILKKQIRSKKRNEEIKSNQKQKNLV